MDVSSNFGACSIANNKQESVRNVKYVTKNYKRKVCEFNWENLVVYQDSYAHDTVL